MEFSKKIASIITIEIPSFILLFMLLFLKKIIMLFFGRKFILFSFWSFRIFFYIVLWDHVGEKHSNYVQLES